MRIVWLSILLLLGMASASSEQIPLEREHGIYMVPVRINQAVNIPFILDSGAAEVAIPADVFMTLMRSHSVRDSDFIGAGVLSRLTVPSTKANNSCSERFRSEPILFETWSRAWLHNGRS